MWLKHKEHSHMFVKQIDKHTAIGWDALDRFCERMYITPNRFIPVANKNICKSLDAILNDHLKDLDLLKSLGLVWLIPYVNRYSSYSWTTQHPVKVAIDWIIQCQSIHLRCEGYRKLEVWQRMEAQNIPERRRFGWSRMWLGSLAYELQYGWLTDSKKGAMQRRLRLHFAASDPAYNLAIWDSGESIDAMPVKKTFFQKGVVWLKSLIFSFQTNK